MDDDTIIDELERGDDLVQHVREMLQCLVNEVTLQMESSNMVDSPEMYQACQPIVDLSDALGTMLNTLFNYRECAMEWASRFEDV